MTSAPLDPEDMPDDEFQVLLDRVVASYARRVEERLESGEASFPAFPDKRVSSATDVVIATKMMLRDFGISPFELSLLSRF
jgi:hypothetical protein